MFILKVNNVNQRIKLIIVYLGLHHSNLTQSKPYIDQKIYGLIQSLLFLLMFYHGCGVLITKKLSYLPILCHTDRGSSADWVQRSVWGGRSHRPRGWSSHST